MNKSKLKPTGNILTPDNIPPGFYALKKCMKNRLKLKIAPPKHVPKTTSIDMLTHINTVDELRAKGWKSDTKATLELVEKVKVGAPKRYTEEAGIEFFALLIDWLASNPDVAFWKHFYLETAHKSFFSYHAMAQFRQFETCQKMYEFLLELQEARIINLVMQGKLPTRMAERVLSQYHQWTNRSETELVVSSKEISFRFNEDHNNELDNSIDTEYTDVTDEPNGE